MADERPHALTISGMFGDMAVSAIFLIGTAVVDYLKRRLTETKLTGTDGCIYRTKANCLRICEQGPIAVVYPEGIWYGQVQADDVSEIIEEHLEKGNVVERLALIEMPECQSK